MDEPPYPVPMFKPTWAKKMPVAAAMKPNTPQRVGRTMPPSTNAADTANAMMIIL